MYFWKSRFYINNAEKEALDSFKIKRLYLKYFDVVWDESVLKPLPVADLEMDTLFNFKAFDIVPCVYITTDVLKNIDSTKILDLAEKIFTKINKKSEKYGLSFQEIQIDFDWNKTTKDRYFYLLSLLKNKISKEQSISVTLRLYPYRYPVLAGVPPVDKAILMCYNMSSIRDFDTRNSILDTVILEKYLRDADDYPLPLDRVLPIFQWTIIFDADKQFLMLSSEFNSSSLSDTNSFKRFHDNIYQLKKDTTIHGQSFSKNFYFRNENVPAETLLKSRTLLDKYLPSESGFRVIYHLDSLHLNYYELKTLQEILN